MRRSGSKHFLLFKVHDAQTNSIPIPDKNNITFIECSGNKLCLNDHIANLHVNLIKFTQWRGAILNDIRNCVECLSQVYWHRLFHCCFPATKGFIVVGLNRYFTTTKPMPKTSPSTEGIRNFTISEFNTRTLTASNTTSAKTPMTCNVINVNTQIAIVFLRVRS